MDRYGVALRDGYESCPWRWMLAEGRNARLGIFMNFLKGVRECGRIG